MDKPYFATKVERVQCIIGLLLYESGQKTSDRRQRKYNVVHKTDIDIA